MQAPLTTRVLSSPSSFSVQPFLWPVRWFCHSSGVSFSTHVPTRFRSFFSEKCAPWTQQPASGRLASMPWQPRPKMQVHREVSQVRSALIRCAESAGSTNSTHCRGKSSGTSGMAAAYVVAPTGSPKSTPMLRADEPAR